MKIGSHNINNWWVIGGAGGLVGILYFYGKSAKSSAAASQSSSAGSASSIDPVTGLPYSQDSQTDPVTGLTYLAEAQEYGSVQAAETEITSGSAYYGVSGAGSSVDSGYPTYYPGSSGTGTPSQQSFSSNAQWAQAVTSGLVALGYSAQDVSTALGLFFAEQPLGSGSDGVSYASIIQAAEAEYGPPPQGTYSIIPQSGNTSPPPNQTPPPSTTPKTPPAVTGLRVTGVTGNSVSLAWNPSPGIANGGGYYVVNYTHTNAQGGLVNVGPVLTSDAPSITVTGLASKATYIFYVQSTEGGKTYAGSDELSPEVSITATTS